VGKVWLVNEAARTIERWTAASEFPDTQRGSIAWTPSAALPPLVVAEAELFGPKSDGSTFCVVVERPFNAVWQGGATKPVRHFT